MTTKLGINPKKTMGGDLTTINRLISSEENFAFSRFSDGEILVLNSLEVLLGENENKIHHSIFPAENPPDDHKHYIPSEHEFYRQKLEDAIKHRGDNYYKGISCKCCIVPMWGRYFYDSQFELIGLGDEHNLTWSNLFINSNYRRFIIETVPLLRNRDVVLIINEAADISKLSFKVKKEFRIGQNCMINNYDIIEEIKKYIESKEIKDTVFLSAASSLSNMIIHQCYAAYPDNTYLDIGSALNPLISGVGGKREYMKQLHDPDMNMRVCVW